MTEYLAVKNWDKFQRYKDREPKWIMVYRSLLMDYKYEVLNDAEFGQLVKIWLLASQLENKVPNNPNWIKKKCSMSQKPNLPKYIRYGFLVLYESVQNCTETDTYSVHIEDKRREEKDICINGFEEFWELYPKKVGKGAARKAWKKLKPSKDLQAVILQSVVDHENSDQWKKDNRQYIPNPATFLNQERWSDVVEISERVRDEPVVRDTQDPVAKKLIREFTDKHSLT